MRVAVPLVLLATLSLGWARAEAAEPTIELRVLTGRSGAPVRLSFALAKPSPRTRLSIYDLSGREIARLLDGDLAAGRSELTWDAHDREGRRVPPGLYFARLAVSGAASVQRLVVTR